jgi:hypothetical protein
MCVNGLYFNNPYSGNRAINEMLTLAREIISLERRGIFDFRLLIGDFRFI